MDSTIRTLMEILNLRIDSQALHWISIEDTRIIICDQLQSLLIDLCTLLLICLNQGICDVYKRQVVSMM